jgi:tetratricopeptide (TPR) repeat protein
MRVRRALVLALGRSLLILMAGCRKTTPVPGDATAEGSADASPVGDVARADSRAADGDSVPASDAARPASRTQEELLDEARRKVAEAEVESKGESVDCDKIVRLLDVSFMVADPRMSPDDKAAFFAFAACAKKTQRWRLLRAVTDAIVAGDPAQKTIYYLPRALVGLGQYESASRLAAATLRSWPKDGEAYTTAALASTRVDDWESCIKQADQALLVQHQKGASDEITAQAHVFKAEALLHQGKVDESSKELDFAKKIHASDLATKLRERNDVVKGTGLLIETDLPDEVPLAVYPFFLKSLPLTGALVTLRLTNLADKPVTVRVEVSLSGVAEPIGKSVTVVRGRRETLRLTPPLRADFKMESFKIDEERELGYKVSSADGQVLYEDLRKVSVLPPDQLPFALQAREKDERLVPELAASFATPGSKAVVALVDTAKRRAPAGQFAGNQGETLPQIQALWDELRTRGFSFWRDPSMDSEAQRSRPVRLPAEVIATRSGDALEGSLLFASLMEVLGLDVVLSRVPGHVVVGWLPSKADRASPEAMNVTVQSPLGPAFFLETTWVGVGPSDAAVLRGDAEFVDASSKRVFDDGRGSTLRLSALRNLGLLPQAE